MLVSGLKCKTQTQRSKAYVDKELGCQSQVREVTILDLDHHIYGDPSSSIVAQGQREVTTYLNKLLDSSGAQEIHFQLQKSTFGKIQHIGNRIGANLNECNGQLGVHKSTYLNSHWLSGLEGLTAIIKVNYILVFQLPQRELLESLNYILLVT
ncbi:Hypothetical_protein [Hexamita inflata]|uniref:Hypothetical_protein n=1 Tax=Hexamita inflata TaxID=28002 RepID=A0AA86QDD5_9EUKA|nr:Hypothetical protein HINF_LOCUS44854 [Hexamita inflata]